jgi:hypothetical protein
LLNLRVCMVAIIGPVVAVAGLAVAIVVPCVHHLRGFSREGIRFIDYIEPQLYAQEKCRCNQIYLFFIERCSRGQGAEATHDSHQTITKMSIYHQTSDD